MPWDTFFGCGPDQDKIPIDSEDTSAQTRAGAKDGENVPGKVGRLSTQGAAGQGDFTKAGQKRERDGKMNCHPAHRDDHVGSQLQQPLAQDSYLRPRTIRPCRPQPQLLPQHIGCRRHQHPELVGVVWHKVCKGKKERGG
jgi:hypothetical protein